MILPILCSTPDDPYRVVVPRSTRKKCATCGCEVMVSPATRDLKGQSEQRTEFWCLPCAQEYCKIHGPFTEFLETFDQAQERAAGGHFQGN